MICKQCNEPFTPANKRGPKPKFCSAACKQAHHRGNKARTRARAKPKPVTPARPDYNRELKPETRNTGPARPQTTVPVADGYKTIDVAIDDLDLSPTMRQMAIEGRVFIHITGKRLTNE